MRRADLDGAQHRGLEFGIVLFDVERDLHVGHLAAEWLHQPHSSQHGEDDEDADAETQHRFGAELRRVEAPRGQDQREESATDEDEAATKQELRPPPAAHLPDDLDEFLAIETAAPCISHEVLLRCPRIPSLHLSFRR